MLEQIAIPFPDKRKGYICKCCGLFVKSYKRSLNCNMALALLFLYKNMDRGYIHLEKELQEAGNQRCGDASYLRHYGLIKSLPEKREDGSVRNGYYKITSLGIMFVEGKIKMQQNFIMFNNKCEGFKGKQITIQEALGKKFDYEQLMQF